MTLHDYSILQTQADFTQCEGFALQVVGVASKQPSSTGDFIPTELQKFKFK